MNKILKLTLLSTVMLSNLMAMQDQASDPHEDII